MGNPDLIIIFNGRAILIHGTKYNSRDEAVALGISKIRERISEDIKALQKAPEEQRADDWESVIAQWESDKEVKKIEVYEM